eukprot:469095-Prymnesium_polylepis.3
MRDFARVAVARRRARPRGDRCAVRVARRGADRERSDTGDRPAGGTGVCVRVCESACRWTRCEP